MEKRRDESCSKAYTTARTLALKAIEYSRVEPRIEEMVKRRGRCVVIGGNEFCPRGKVFVVGAGKASGRMAETLERILGDLVEGGYVSVLKQAVHEYSTRRVELIGAGHPVPDKGSLEAGRKVLELARSLGEDDLLLVLISGGGSALMEQPVDPSITLGDLAELNKLLLKSGATIYEINTVRKHISAVKGGRLAEAAYPARIVALIVSDVPGDRIDMVASGPTAPDPTTYRDAVAVLDKYGLRKTVPESVRRVLEAGAEGALPETPKPGSPIFSRVDNVLIATSLDALRKLEEYARSLGLRTLLLTTRLEGESREVGVALATIALEALDRGVPVEPPAAILAGGETYVTVRGDGLGGRNMELALSFAIKVRGEHGVAIAALDTDGIDGVTDAAGAVADPHTIEQGLELGLDPTDYLDRNDSYRFFQRVGGLLKTGPTHTNLKSMYVVVVMPRERPDTQGKGLCTGTRKPYKDGCQGGSKPL